MLDDELSQNKIKNRYFFIGLIFLAIVAFFVYYSIVYKTQESNLKASVSDVVDIVPGGNFILETQATTTDVNSGNSIEPVNNETSTLLFVGDIMLSRAIGSVMNKNNNWSYPFLKMADLLKKADLTFGNLEGPISKNGVKVGSIYSFRADPKSIEGLLFSGFDVVSVANNHMWDYGGEAFKDTFKILKENNISYVGGGFTYDEAHAPIVKEVNDTKIAYLGYTNLLPVFLGDRGDKLTVAFPDEDQLVLDIHNAKRLADIVVVSFHWGDEYETYHNSFQEKLAHLAIDAGANLIVGHHPHVIQDIEKYKDVYIAYSLGNFVFDQNFSEDTRSGLLLNVVLKDKKIEQVTSQKVNFNSSYQPLIID